MVAILEDFIAGFAVGQVTMFVIGAWSLLLGAITGLLWVAGGRGWLGTNLWRRVGISFIISTTFAVAKHSFLPLIAFPLMWGSMAIGYGTPSTQPPDAGSWLGRIFGKWTRVAWFIILAIAMLPLFLK